MVVILFVAVFFGSLLATSLAFSGWSLWLSAVVYLTCGFIGVALMFGLPKIFSIFVRSLKWMTSRCLPFIFWTRAEENCSDLQSVPDLSEYLFSSSRNRRQ